MPTEYGKTHLIHKANAILRADPAEKDAMIAELPDCVIVVESMPSTVAKLLVEVADYEIVPLPAVRAILADNLQDSDAIQTVIQREFLQRTVIPAYSYFTTRGFPETDCETLGVRLLLVARKDVPALSVQPLMRTVFQGQFARRIQPQSPREFATPYAIHPAALAFLDREKPLAIAETIDWFSKGLSIFGAFSARALSLYSLLWRKKARKPSDYYAELRKLDQLGEAPMLIRQYGSSRTRS